MLSWWKVLELPERLAIGVVGLVLVIGLLIAWAHHHDKVQQAKGANAVTTAVQGKVIDDVASAKAAVEAHASDPAVRHSGCVRWSRTPQNCQ